MENEIICKIIEKFHEKILKTHKISSETTIFEINKEHLSEIIDYSYNSLNGCFLTMTGTDYLKINSNFLLDYMLGWYSNKQIIIFRTKIHRDEETFTSITNIVPCADWYEREVKESLGLNPLGHPNPRKLLLSDDWPDNIFPLRKNYKNEIPPLNKEANYPFDSPENAEIFNIIPYGPYHFAIHEPIYFRFYTEGEKISKIDLRVGFNYRGLEKIAETRMTYSTIPFLAERICGICGSVHAEAYTQAVEKAASFEAPERAKWIRVVFLEIERIHSHLLWLGVASHMVGFDSGLMQFWRVRDRIMFLAEILTGNRKLYGIIVPGGVRRDINNRKKEHVLKELSEISIEYTELTTALLNLTTLKTRLKGIGFLSQGEAKKFSVMGPVARASNVSIDSRRDYTYEAYSNLEFNLPLRSEGDVLARTLVRVNEVTESLSIIKQALEGLPDGPVYEPIEYIPPDTTSVGIVEGPRGTDVHYIITGENTVYRWRVRAPTYANLPATPIMLKDQNLADAPVIIGSIDPCISCAERFIVIDNKNREKIYNKKILEDKI
ncbi:NADH-quinone oxidoreductase subunit C [Candidatus Bathyarchaeota archaeon]|nr:NADH-quinone oxidoreductase subunit C [Candidatus Bathyarchaeota archaeon]